MPDEGPVDGLPNASPQAMPMEVEATQRPVIPPVPAEPEKATEPAIEKLRDATGVDTAPTSEGDTQLDLLAEAEGTNEASVEKPEDAMDVSGTQLDPGCASVPPRPAEPHGHEATKAVITEGVSVAPVSPEPHGQGASKALIEKPQDAMGVTASTSQGDGPGNPVVAALRRPDTCDLLIPTPQPTVRIKVGEREVIVPMTHQEAAALGLQIVEDLTPAKTLQPPDVVQPPVAPLPSAPATVPANEAMVVGQAAEPSVTTSQVNTSLEAAHKAETEQKKAEASLPAPPTSLEIYEAAANAAALDEKKAGTSIFNGFAS